MSSEDLRGGAKVVQVANENVSAEYDKSEKSHLIERKTENGGVNRITAVDFDISSDYFFN